LLSAPAARQGKRQRFVPLSSSVIFDMPDTTSKLGMIGIICGGVALLLALVHFYAGPLSPQPALETSIAEKAVEIRDATVAALRGEDIEKKTFTSEMNLDQIVQIVTAVLGGVAVILGVAGWARGESKRAAIGAAFLGAFAIGFQFLGVALGLIIVAIILGAVLSQLGFG
jgi:hypothetical protein